MNEQQLIHGLAQLVASSEDNSDASMVLEALARGKASAGTLSSPASQDRHHELDAAVSKLMGVERGAPQWAHDLLDFLWDLLF